MPASNPKRVPRSYELLDEYIEEEFIDHAWEGGTWDFQLESSSQHMGKARGYTKRGQKSDNTV